jgi:nucleolar protein 56
LRAKLFVSEAGIALLDEGGTPLASARFQEDMFTKYSETMAGRKTEELRILLDQAKGSGITELENPYEELQEVLSDSGLNVLKSDDRARFEAEKEELMLRAGLVFSRDEVMDIVRSFALRRSEERIREKAAKPDLQVVQSIMAVDELDKILNLTTARVREWYGLHFPELDNLIQDPLAYCRFVASVGLRTNCDEEKLKGAGLSESKVSAIVEAAGRSKGGEIREEDLEALMGLAAEAVSIAKQRDRLMKHVERSMKRLAPNLSDIAGPAIGARLIAKVGSLERLARLPSSTIQVLGAEKALFRALKSGGRPPKHGLLFQHSLVHSAAQWQRGKVARALASKIALGARMDYFRGERFEGFSKDALARVEEIKKKYPHPREDRPSEGRRNVEAKGRRRG